MARAAARIEKRGIPTVATVRNEFIGVAKITHSSLGFAPELAQVNYPVQLFMTGADLSPISEHLGDYVAGLTQWQPEITAKGIVTPQKIMVEGATYEEALDKMNQAFLMNQWSDGSPLLAPTQERVDWILTGTDLPRDMEIGRVPPRSGIATVEGIATALAACGGRPEYLPVMIAIVQGLCMPEFETSAWQTTSRGVFPVVIVNGPIGKQLRISKTFGCLGPDSQRPAGVRIGRAIRMLLLAMGGATPGEGTMSCYGNYRTTGVVIAEDEELLPPDWKPLNTEYGFAAGTNTVLLNVSALATNIWRRGHVIGETPEEEAEESLDVVAWYMRIPPKHPFPDGGFANGGGHGSGSPVGIYLINSLVANQMAEVGWTKAKIRQRLWELTHTPKEQWLQYGREVRRFLYDNPDFDLDTLPDMIPMYEEPDNLIIAVAGGRHPSQNFWLGEGYGMNPVVEVKLPAKWDELIAKAEEDLGPLPIDP